MDKFSIEPSVELEKFSNDVANLIDIENESVSLTEKLSVLAQLTGLLAVVAILDGYEQNSLLKFVDENFDAGWQEYIKQLRPELEEAN